MTGAGVLHGAGHGRVAQPGADGINDHPLVGEPPSPWVCHQECAHKLCAYAKQQPVVGHRTDKGAAHSSVQSIPRCDEALDDENYQMGLDVLPNSGARHPSPAHPGMAIGGTEWPLTGMRHLLNQHLLRCLGRKSLVFCANHSWTGCLLDIIPRYALHRCKTFREMAM